MPCPYNCRDNLCGPHLLQGVPSLSASLISNNSCSANNSNSVRYTRSPLQAANSLRPRKQKRRMRALEGQIENSGWIAYFTAKNRKENHNGALAAGPYFLSFTETRESSATGKARVRGAAQSQEWWPCGRYRRGGRRSGVVRLRQACRAGGHAQRRR